jgi:hypothetical protein
MLAGSEPPGGLIMAKQKKRERTVVFADQLIAGLLGFRAVESIYGLLTS